MQPTFKRTFLAGIVVLTPLLVTVWLLSILLTQLHGLITPLILSLLQALGFGAWAQSAWAQYAAPLVSLALAVLLVYLVGRIAQNILGKQLLRGVDALFMKLPFVRGIYKATRQFLDTFSASREDAFRKVVLVEYPRRDAWTLALLTGDAQGEIAGCSEKDLVGLYIPTTPNPTSGYLVYVPREDIVPLEMSVEEAFKVIISGGVLTPGKAKEEALAS